MLSEQHKLAKPVIQPESNNPIITQEEQQRRSVDDIEKEQEFSQRGLQKKSQQERPSFRGLRLGFLHEEKYTSSRGMTTGMVRSGGGPLMRDPRSTRYPYMERSGGGPVMWRTPRHDHR